MLVFMRCFRTSKVVHNLVNPIPSEITKIISHKAFHPIRENIQKELKKGNDTKIAQILDDSIDVANIPVSEKGILHNMIIEGMTKHDYSIVMRHANRLVKSNQKLSTEALIEMILHNPGRVSSSWEMFLENKEYVNRINDEILYTVLSKIISFDKVDVQDGKKNLTLRDLTRSIILINFISDKNIIENDMIKKLINRIFELNAPFCIPLLKGLDIPISYFIENFDSLSNYQMYQMFKLYGIYSLSSNKEQLNRIVSNIGKNEKIGLNEEEFNSFELFQEEVKLIEQQMKTIYHTPNSCFEEYETKDDFENIEKEIFDLGLDKNNVDLSLLLMDITGMFKNNIPKTYKLYEKYIKIYDNSKKLFSPRLFQIIAYQAYKNVDRSILDSAKKYISSNNVNNSSVDILRTLILVYSKLDVNESLEIFNSNIQMLSNEKFADNNLSEKSQLTEALLIAFLANNDLDFARVIFEGGVREKIISSPSEVKRIKKIMSDYGEAFENKTSIAYMDGLITNELRNMS